MSIEVTFHRISPEQFHRITTDQTAWDDFRGTGFPGLSREEIFAIVRSPLREDKAKLIAAFEKQSEDASRLDISKDWHVLYYLLSGSAKISEEHREGQPLHNVIFGGHATSVNTGYGPVRYFDHFLVAEIAAALDSISKSRLIERFIPEEMRRLNIYAAPLDREECESILDLFDHMREFFRNAVQAKEYVIVYGH